MPIYEYHCQSCSKTIEKIQQQAQDEISCPACGEHAKRSVSVFAAATAGSSGGGCVSPPAGGFG